ncbi:hypothetical protein SUVZ_14G1870 [Saccharomyces uvarum]|uniref:Chromatin modification-related protein EAF7 n=1 Tax=Saccharomyces uvarum TaxID=230603 RepID=A0ABN8WJI6_SACUV|nr:hypothetical protein SUVZ_14G1870 [Saccharomyces uvarum]
MAVHWTIVDEIRLLRWASEFKPAGIHKHFHMFCIVERMNSPDKYPVTLLQKETMKLGKVFTATDIWEKLSQSYNLKDIDKRETTYPVADTTDSTMNDNDYDDNDGNIHEETLLELNNRIRTRKQDFTLPWDEYGELILENAKKSPTPNEEETQIEPLNDKNDQIPKEIAENHLKNVKEEENKDVEDRKVDEVKEPQPHTNENNNPTLDSKSESMQGPPDDGEDKKTEHSSDEEQKMKNESKTAAPIRKSQRLKKNKEVKFEDEGEEEEEGVEKEQEEDEGLMQEDSDKVNEEGEESNENEEENDEREKSSSSEITNGSESEEVEETLEFESDREREGTEKDLSAKPDSERDSSKRKTENKNEDSTQDGAKKNYKAQDEPLAKRTRHSSSAGNTSNETSPKRQRRKAGSRKNRTPATRVSSRLRNKK